jgi:hypothetical protein
MAKKDVDARDKRGHDDWRGRAAQTKKARPVLPDVLLTLAARIPVTSNI